jgi:hypothetical protein
MGNCTFIKYKNKEIIYLDHRGLKGPELTIAGDEVWKYLKTNEITEGMKRYKKFSVLGVSGMKKIMLNTYNAITGNKTKAFDSEEEAKEWLVK